MTHKETGILFMEIAALYPRDKSFAEADAITLKIWQRMLEDIPFDHAEAALKIHAASSIWPPSVAEIIQTITDIRHPILGADEAYGLLREAERKYGWCRQQEAKASLPEDVWECVKNCFGTFYDYCVSDTPEGVARAQFAKFWEAHKKRAQQRNALPEAVRNAFLKIAEGVRLPE